MKQSLLALLLCITLAFTVNTSQALDVNETTIEQSVYDQETQTQPVLFADASVPTVKEASNEKVTPQDVAEILDENVIPGIERISDLLEDAPDKEEPTATKINYWLVGAITFGTWLIGLFIGGGKDNRFQNLKTS